ncbi:metallophosphatase family protein [Chloroflexi bacterium TSY]|nr:metallophosphatase family protein [Chloroflexi bacterium TSY]
MRIALLSDIHGNSIALDAVLEDIELLDNVTDYWILGDLAGLGPDLVGVLERLSQLENAVIVRGNTDQYIVEDERPGPHASDVENDVSLLPLYGIVAKQLGWTQGAITSRGWLKWVETLPVEGRLTLPDGKRLLGVHASPGRYDGTGIHPRLTDDEMRYLLGDCNADLVCVGHTHWPMDHRIADIHVVNLGCVSNPLPPDLRACYVILDADESGYQIEHRRVDYDRDAVIEMIRQVKYPNGEYLVEGFNGLHKPKWRSPLIES